MVIATSAVLRGARPLLPEKMTSSMSAARIALCEDSPMTQRTASTRFDLPQPFGPTTPVNPGSISKSVASTKDLKPIRRSRVSFIRLLRPCASLRHSESQTPHAPLGEVKRCRIGAENESARRQAQQVIRVIQNFALSRPAKEVSGGSSDKVSQAKKPLSFLEIGAYLFRQ